MGPVPLRSEGLGLGKARCCAVVLAGRPRLSQDPPSQQAAEYSLEEVRLAGEPRPRKSPLVKKEKRVWDV